MMGISISLSDRPFRAKYIDRGLERVATRLSSWFQAVATHWRTPMHSTSASVLVSGLGSLRAVRKKKAHFHLDTDYHHLRKLQRIDCFSKGSGHMYARIAPP